MSSELRVRLQSIFSTYRTKIRTNLHEDIGLRGLQRPLNGPEYFQVAIPFCIL